MSFAVDEFKNLERWLNRYFSEERILSADGRSGKMLKDALVSLKRRKNKSEFLNTQICHVSTVNHLINNVLECRKMRIVLTSGIKDHYYNILNNKRLTDHYIERVKLGHNSAVVRQIYKYLSRPMCCCSICEYFKEQRETS